MPWLRVPYEHNSADLTPVYLAVSKRKPEASEWVPAFRDTVDGTRVIQVKVEVPPDYNVWLRDGDGIRMVSRMKA